MVTIRRVWDECHMLNMFPSIDEQAELRHTVNNKYQWLAALQRICAYIEVYAEEDYTSNESIRSSNTDLVSA